MTNDEIIAVLKTECEDARIVDGEIHAYGFMPNSNQVGWYLFGYLDDPQSMAVIKSIQEGR